MNWELVLAIVGAVSGLSAAIRWLLKDVSALKQRPELEIADNPDAKEWTFLNTGETRRFATVEVTNKKNQTAQRCVAVAEVIEHPDGLRHLQRRYPLHWADVPYSSLSTGAEAVDIGAAPRRLDIAFTVPSVNGESWIAMPLALSHPGRVPQATLPAGEYVLEIQVSCDNGKGDTRQFKLISPSQWQDLEVNKI